MQPIYDLEQSVRDDVTKLRSDSHIKATTGGWVGGWVGGVQAMCGLGVAFVRVVHVNPSFPAPSGIMFLNRGEVQWG